MRVNMMSEKLFKNVVSVMVLVMLSISASRFCVCGPSGSDYDKINTFLKGPNMSQKTPEELVGELSAWRQSELKLKPSSSRTKLINKLNQLLQLSEALEAPLRCTKHSIETLKMMDAAVEANIYSETRLLNEGSPVRKLVIEFAKKHYELCDRDYHDKEYEILRTMKQRKKLARIGAFFAWQILEAKAPPTLFALPKTDPRYRKFQIASLQTSSINGREVYKALSKVMEKFGKEPNVSEDMEPANKETNEKLIEHLLLEPCEAFIEELSDVLVPAENDLILAQKVSEDYLPYIYKSVASARLCRRFFLDEQNRQNLALDTAKHIADAKTKRQLIRFSTSL